MLFGFVFNTIIFFIIMNFNWLIGKGWKRGAFSHTLQRFIWPALLGGILAAVDQFRIMMLYQILILLALLFFSRWLMKRLQNKGFFRN